MHKSTIVMGAAAFLIVGIGSGMLIGKSAGASYISPPKPTATPISVHDANCGALAQLCYGSQNDLSAQACAQLAKYCQPISQWGK